MKWTAHPFQEEMMKSWAGFSWNMETKLYRKWRTCSSHSLLHASSMPLPPETSRLPRYYEQQQHDGESFHIQGHVHPVRFWRYHWGHGDPSHGGRFLGTGSILPEHRWAFKISCFIARFWFDRKKDKRIELHGLTTISSGMRPPSLQPKGTSAKVMALLQDIGGKPSSFYVHHHCSNSFFRVYVFTAGAASMLQENLLLSPPFGLGGSPSCCSGSISVVDVHVFFVSTFLFSLAFASLFGYAG